MITCAALAVLILRLTPSTRARHSPACLQTTGNGIGVPNDIGGHIRRPGGFFLSTACAASSMAVRVGEPQGSPVPMSRYANLTRDRHPRLASGRGFQTADIGAPAMRNTASGTRALAPTTPTIHTSYTPGPWHEHSHRQIGPDEGIVCEVWSAIGWGDAAIQQADANVRLIAAAPDLHQALAEIMGDYRNDLAVIRPRTLKLIVSVLARVEGGAA